MLKRSWLFVLAGCYLGGPTSSGDLPSDAPVDVASLPPPDPSLPRVRRLSIREVSHAYADLLGEAIATSEFLPEQGATNFDNGPALLMMQTDQAARFEVVAWQAAERVTTRREPKVFANCHLDQGAYVECRDVLVAELAKRAYRRPLTNVEALRLTQLYDQVAAQSGAETGLKAVIAAIFQAPAFLYREELGTPTKTGGLRLTSYEVASEISFFIAGTTPDDALLAAAATGALDTGVGRRTQAERLLATPSARGQWRDFLRDWLAVLELPETTKSRPYALPPALIRAMDADLNDLFDRVLWQSSGSLDELFSTNVGFVGATLAPVYGLDGRTDPPKEVALDLSTRGGVLTRAGWLAVHSAPDNSAPIARGVFVLSSLLCQPPPAPPAGITRFAPTTSATKTTRERFALHTQNPQCQACHASIDGAGFGFEEFDPLGHHRTTEGGEQVDTSGTVNLDGTAHPFVGVTELSADLRASENFRSCFVKQLFRFAMGAPENALTLPTLMTVASGFRVTDRIDALALALIESDSFVTREVAGAK